MDKIIEIILLDLPQNIFLCGMVYLFCIRTGKDLYIDKTKIITAVIIFFFISVIALNLVTTDFGTSLNYMACFITAILLQTITLTLIWKVGAHKVFAFVILSYYIELIIQLINLKLLDFIGINYLLAKGNIYEEFLISIPIKVCETLVIIMTHRRIKRWKEKVTKK